MDFNPEEIQQLIVEEIAGTISEADKEYLYQVLADNQEAYNLWRDMHAVLTTDEVTEAQARLPVDIPERIIRNARRRKRNLYIISTSGIVALLLVAGIGWRMLFQTGITTKEAAPLATNTKRVELKLASGKTIDLSTDQGQVQLGGITLNNTNKTLTYSPDNRGKREQASLHVPAGKDYKIRLSDGTEVWLNSATDLKFPFSFDGKTREISINGEAYLKVAENAAQPFIVHLPHSSVQVLGTEFNINTYDPGQVKVALVKGSVKMQAREKARVLKPGYEAVYSPKQGMQVSTFDVDEVLSWQKGIYMFYNATLEEVCQIVPRWYGVKLVLDDNEAGKRRFSGVIDRNKPVKNFLEDLKATNGINYYVTGETIHIK